MRDRLAEVRFEEAGVADAVVAEISGEVDGSNVAEVQRAISEHVPTTARALIIDLSQTSYIDSTGVELLFEIARRLSSRRQAFSVVVPAGSGVRRVLELCDIGSVGTLVATRTEALVAASRPAGL